MPIYNIIICTSRHLYVLYIYPYGGMRIIYIILLCLCRSTPNNIIYNVILLCCTEENPSRLRLKKIIYYCLNSVWRNDYTRWAIVRFIYTHRSYIHTAGIHEHLNIRTTAMPRSCYVNAWSVVPRCLGNLQTSSITIFELIIEQETTAQTTTTTTTAILEYYAQI